MFKFNTDSKNHIFFLLGIMIFKKHNLVLSPGWDISRLNYEPFSKGYRVFLFCFVFFGGGGEGGLMPPPWGICSFPK